MQLRWAWYFGLVVLGGCSTDRHYANPPTSQQIWENDLSACKNTYPDEHRKPVKPRILCFSRANEARAAREGNTDLVRAMTTVMLVAAENYDAGELTPAAYDASRAAIFAEFNAQMELRLDKQAAPGAGHSQAGGAWAAAMPH
jgi:hypothetical protein